MTSDPFPPLATALTILLATIMMAFAALPPPASKDASALIITQPDSEPGQKNKKKNEKKRTIPKNWSTPWGDNLPASMTTTNSTNTIAATHTIHNISFSKLPHQADPAIASDIDPQELEQRANQNDPEAQYLLAVQLAQENPQRATALLQQAAAQNIFRAQHLLASRHLNGEGTPQNSGQANYWYQRAATTAKEQAELGDHEAMRLLGLMAEEGQGQPQDLNAAKEWYEKAVEAGSEGAVWRLQQINQTNDP